MLINIFLLALIFIVLIGIFKNFKGNKRDSGIILAPDSTGALKGLAILMIAFAHVCQHESTFAQIIVGGKPAARLIFSWGAVGVSIFFLLSGYGCFLSINKTDNHIGWLFKHVLKMVCHYIYIYL